MIIIFWMSLLVIIYTFICYPLIIWLLKVPLNKQFINEKKYNKPITVVMVACNEENVIKRKIENIYCQDYEASNINFIIVDDASDDQTVECIQSLNKYSIKLIEQPTRKGKAAGLNAAMNQVETELVMFVDARQEITTNAMADLSSWFVSNKNTVAVSGEVKFRTDAGVIGGMDAYQIYERNIRLSESMISSVPGVSGAIYMLKTDAFECIPEDTILDDVLIPMNAAKKGGWIGFDERVVAWDIPSDDMDREKKRKTRTLNGNYQLLFKHLGWCFPLGHPIWFQFVSHKVLRLLAPFMAILMIGSAFSIGYAQNAFIFSVGLFALLGILLYPISIVVPVINKLTLLRVGTSFVALNWFNLLGFFQYLFSTKVQSWK